MILPHGIQMTKFITKWLSVEQGVLKFLPGPSFDDFS